MSNFGAWGKALASLSGKAATTAAERQAVEPAIKAAVESGSSSSVGSSSTSLAAARPKRRLRSLYVGGFRRRTPEERERRALARASILAPTPSPVTDYPFASNVIARPRIALKDPRVSVQPDGQVKRGIMAAVHEQLRQQYDADGTRTALFSRKSPQCLPPGSVLSVDTWNDSSRTSFSTFSGVIIAIRRRQTSTSFVLRAIVNKTGVEVRYNIYSPTIKDIKVVQRADGNRRASPLRRFRRAKLYFLRNHENRLPNVVRFTQNLRNKEEQEQRLLQQQAKANDAATQKQKKGKKA